MMIQYEITLDGDGIRELIIDHLKKKFDLNVTQDEVRLEGKEFFARRNEWDVMEIRATVTRRFDHLI